MSRRTERMAQEAAEEASAAARVLQARAVQKRESAAPQTAETPPKRLDRAPHPNKSIPGVFDSQAAMEDEIVGRHAKTEGWREVAFQKGEDGETRTTIGEEQVDPNERDDSEETEQEPASEAAPAASEDKSAEAAPEADAAPQQGVKAPEIKTIRVKVDDEEFDVPEEEVNEAGGVRAYRIQRAAENRLRKANESLAETNRIKAELSRLLEEQSKPKEPTVTDDQFIASKIDAMRFGTPEESAGALQEIITRALSKNKVDPNQIVEQALARSRYETSMTKFRSEFPEVVSNPLLGKLFMIRRNEEFDAAVKSGAQSIDFDAVFSKIGNELKGLTRGHSQPASGPQAQTTGTPSQAQSEKEARKASIVSLPTASARAEAPKEEKQQTHADIVEEMRRGQFAQTG